MKFAFFKPRVWIRIWILTIAGSRSAQERPVGLEPLPDLRPALIFCARLKGDSGTGTPGSGHSSRSSPKRAQLVSYHDVDAGLTDEEHEPGTVPT